MTGQLCLDFPDPVPVVEGHHRGQHITVRRVTSPPLLKAHMWWRGRRRRITTVPTPGGVL